MTHTTGILIFPDAEELDVVGPWEVFAFTGHVVPDVRVVTIAQTRDPVRCAKGMRILPDHTFEDAPPLDLVLVPGGQGTRSEVDNPVLLEWLRKAAASASWITSVCTGSLLLRASGLAKGKRVTTHWAALDLLRARNEGDVLADVRYVRDGNVVTSAGVSAGIDMSLWLVGQIHGVDVARKVQKGIDYNPAPPYAAEV